MSHDTGTLHFGDRELDFARRELREAGKPVALQPTPLRVLLYLAAHRDRTVPRRELLDAIWPGVVVGDEALTTALAEARHAVGDDGAAQRVIRTLKGAGYRFVAEVVVSADESVTGVDLPRETERRLTAILSGDVVEYSRLIAEDEPGTVRTLRAWREQVGALISEHRGRLADFTGDNFLAEFPTALDAVSCAVETQRVLAARNLSLRAERRLEFRLGVHLGDVRVDGERLFGNGVNVAARLQGLAEPGGICVSAAVHEQVRSKLEISYQDLGEQPLKNIPQPVRVYRVGTNGHGPLPDAPRRDRARAPVAARARAAWLRRALALAAPFSLIALIAGLVIGRDGTREVRTSPRATPVTRTMVELPASAPLAVGAEPPLLGFETRSLALSPDGLHLIYVGRAAEGTRLYYRSMDRFAAPRALPGTEGALYAFFSPDGKEVGFLTPDRVKKTSIDGETVTTLCPARSPIGASWIARNEIFFFEDEGTTLSRISGAGGQPAELVRLGPIGPVLSEVLPDGRAALVTSKSDGSWSAEYATVELMMLSDFTRRPLISPGYDGQYLPTGHLQFARAGALMAAPFDLERLRVTGAEVVVVRDVGMESVFGNVHAASSTSGTLVYVPGGDFARGKLAWVDRQGASGVLAAPEHVYVTFDINPDDRRFAVAIHDVNDYVWIWDDDLHIGKILATRAYQPHWSFDGERVAYGSLRPVTGPVMVQDLHGGAPRALASTEGLSPSGWARNDLFSFDDFTPGFAAVTLGKSGEKPQLAQPRAWGSDLSPDGRYLSYPTDESGRYEVWVREVDGPFRQQVSTDGGVETVWCRACGELFYRNGSKILSSRITFEPAIRLGPPRVAFVLDEFVDTWGISFDVSSDGQRLYYVRRSRPPLRTRIHVVQNWFAELKRLVPAE
jgi:class 3 adenylate cyclase